MMLRVVQCVFEEPADVAACLADRQPPRPRADAGVIGELGQSMCGLRQLVAHLVGVGVAVGADGMVDDVFADRWVRRLVARERLLDAEGVQGGDITAVGGVLDR